MNVQIAIEQPPTTAKVILYTSHGQIDLELWTKQAPLASKNFIQHCLLGYYTNSIFHRLIPGFMIQGGDPTGTGMGGESVFGGPFKDQFHQRLKFSRRGILAMANAGKNTNKSQFFITFGPCEHLNKKHTIFGKVVGDTIYNLMAMQSLDTGEQDRPLDPPVIRKIKVVENPFSDIKVKGNEQTQKAQQAADKLQTEERREQQLEKENRNKKQELKKLKNKKKLTFENQQQDDEAPAPKIISSHDVLYKKDASLSNKLSLTKEQIEKKRKEKQIEESKAHSLKNALSLNQSHQPNLDENEDEDMSKLVSKQMHKKRAQFQRNLGDQNVNKDEVLNYIRRYNPTTNKYEIVFQDQLDKQKAEKQKQQELQRKAKQQQEISDQKLRQVREMQLNEYNLLKAEELNFKKAKEGSMKERRKEIIHEEKKLLSNLEKHRYEFTQKQKMNQHEGQLFKKLIDFTSRLKSVQSSKKQENSENQGLEKRQNPELKIKPSKMSWMNHKLKFHIDSTNAYSLQEKALRVGKGNFQDEDDGGLKMEIEYNNDEDEENQNNIEKVLRDI